MLPYRNHKIKQFKSLKLQTKTKLSQRNNNNATLIKVGTNTQQAPGVASVGESTVKLSQQVKDFESNNFQMAGEQHQQHQLDNRQSKEDELLQSMAIYDQYHKNQMMQKQRKPIQMPQEHFQQPLQQQFKQFNNNSYDNRIEGLAAVAAEVDHNLPTNLNLNSNMMNNRRTSASHLLDQESTLPFKQRSSSAAPTEETPGTQGGGSSMLMYYPANNSDNDQMLVPAKVQVDKIGSLEQQISTQLNTMQQQQQPSLRNTADVTRALGSAESGTATGPVLSNMGSSMRGGLYSVPPQSTSMVQTLSQSQLLQHHRSCSPNTLQNEDEIIDDLKKNFVKLDRLFTNKIRVNRSNLVTKGLNTNRNVLGSVTQKALGDRPQTSSANAKNYQQQRQGLNTQQATARQHKISSNIHNTNNIRIVNNLKSSFTQKKQNVQQRVQKNHKAQSQINTNRVQQPHAHMSQSFPKRNKKIRQIQRQKQRATSSTLSKDATVLNFSPSSQNFIQNRASNLDKSMQPYRPNILQIDGHQPLNMQVYGMKKSYSKQKTNLSPRKQNALNQQGPIKRLKSAMIRSVFNKGEGPYGAQANNFGLRKTVHQQRKGISPSRISDHEISVDNGILMSMSDNTLSRKISTNKGQQIDFPTLTHTTPGFQDPVSEYNTAFQLNHNIMLHASSGTMQKQQTIDEPAFIVNGVIQPRQHAFQQYEHNQNNTIGDDYNQTMGKKADSYQKLLLANNHLYQSKQDSSFLNTPENEPILPAMTIQNLIERDEQEHDMMNNNLQVFSQNSQLPLKTQMINEDSRDQDDETEINNQHTNQATMSQSKFSPKSKQQEGGGVQLLVNKQDVSGERTLVRKLQTTKNLSENFQDDSNEQEATIHRKQSYVQHSKNKTQVAPQKGMNNIIHLSMHEQPEKQSSILNSENETLHLGSIKSRKITVSKDKDVVKNSIEEQLDLAYNINNTGSQVIKDGGCSATDLVRVQQVDQIQHDENNWFRQSKVLSQSMLSSNDLQNTHQIMSGRLQQQSHQVINPNSEIEEIPKQKQKQQKTIIMDKVIQNEQIDKSFIVLEEAMRHQKEIEAQRDHEILSMLKEQIDDDQMQMYFLTHGLQSGMIKTDPQCMSKAIIDRIKVQNQRWQKTNLEQKLNKSHKTQVNRAQSAKMRPLNYGRSSSTKPDVDRTSTPVDFRYGLLEMQELEQQLKFSQSKGGGINQQSQTELPPSSASASALRITSGLNMAVQQETIQNSLGLMLQKKVIQSKAANMPIVVGHINSGESEKKSGFEYQSAIVTQANEITPTKLNMNNSYGLVDNALEGTDAIDKQIGPQKDQSHNNSAIKSMANLSDEEIQQENLLSHEDKKNKQNNDDHNPPMYILSENQITEEQYFTNTVDEMLQKDLPKRHVTIVEARRGSQLQKSTTNADDQNTMTDLSPGLRMEKRFPTQTNQTQLTQQDRQQQQQQQRAPSNQKHNTILTTNQDLDVDVYFEDEQFQQQQNKHHTVVQYQQNLQQNQPYQIQQSILKQPQASAMMFAPRDQPKILKNVVDSSITINNLSSTSNSVFNHQAKIMKPMKKFVNLNQQTKFNMIPESIIQRNGPNVSRSLQRVFPLMPSSSKNLNNKHMLNRGQSAGRARPISPNPSTLLSIESSSPTANMTKSNIQRLNQPVIAKIFIQENHRASKFGNTVETAEHSLENLQASQENQQQVSSLQYQLKQSSSGNGGNSRSFANSYRNIASGRLRSLDQDHVSSSQEVQHFIPQQLPIQHQHQQQVFVAPQFFQISNKDQQWGSNPTSEKDLKGFFGQQTRFNEIDIEKLTKDKALRRHIHGHQAVQTSSSNQNQTTSSQYELIKEQAKQQASEGSMLVVARELEKSMIPLVVKSRKIIRTTANNRSRTSMKGVTLSREIRSSASQIQSLKQSISDQKINIAEPSQTSSQEKLLAMNKVTLHQYLIRPKTKEVKISMDTIKTSDILSR